MTAFTRMCFYFLLFLAVDKAIGNLQAGSADDLLPPPARQVEKRALGGDERGRRAYYDGRGGLGGAFSPDGKFLVTSAGYQGITLWDVGTGRALGQLANPINSQGISAAFTPNGKQI